MKLKAGALALFLTPEENKGLYENKKLEERGDQCYVTIEYNEAEGCFKWISKAGKEWAMKPNATDNTLDVQNCPYEDLKVVAILKEDDVVTGVKGPYGEIWVKVEAWSA